MGVGYRTVSSGSRDDSTAPTLHRTPERNLQSSPSARGGGGLEVVENNGVRRPVHHAGRFHES